MPAMFASFSDRRLISLPTLAMESDEESEIQLFSAASTSRTLKIAEKLKVAEKPDYEPAEKRRKSDGESPECVDGEEECGDENSNTESGGRQYPAEVEEEDLVDEEDQVEEKENQVEDEGASKNASPAEENDQNDSQLSLEQLGLNSWLVQSYLSRSKTVVVHKL